MSSPHYVEITFDCLPLRSISRLDIPMDASPGYRDKLHRIKAALETHGTVGTYYLHNANCKFHLTNEPEFGMIEFRFEGTLFTDASDTQAARAQLQVDLVRETVDWLTAPVVEWFHECVTHAVRVEFNRYIASGNLAQTVERLKRLEEEAEQSGGYVGMYL
jgi:hypothetical protein